MAEHYTAVIKVSKTRTVSKGSTYNNSATEEREVQDIANIVVRADTIEKLVDKMGKHTALIEED